MGKKDVLHEHEDSKSTKSPLAGRLTSSDSLKNSMGKKNKRKESNPVVKDPLSTSTEITRTKSAPLSTESLPEMEKSLQYDAATFMKHFETAFRHVNKNLKGSNVLVTGITGAGKSSMINGIFKQDIAPTGAGRPVTQDFAKYEVPGHQVTVFDSKGLEQSNEENYIAELESFFKLHSVDADGGSVNSIHCVWYVINASGARFQPYEEYLCKNYFNRFPVIFVLNKVDIAKKEEVDSLKKVLEGLKLSNLVAICQTISRQEKDIDISQLMKNVEACPGCGSDDLNFSKKIRKVTCGDCGHKVELEVKTGLDSLIDQTIKVLPTVVREAFVSAQQISFKQKEDKVKTIIKDFYLEAKSVSFSSSLLKVIARMLTRISIIWNFKEHGRLCGVHLAQDMVRHTSFRDKMFLFMHRHEKEFIHLTALGVVWNRCVRNLALSLCTEFSKEGMNKIDSHWHQLFEASFKSLGDEEIYHLEGELEELGLDVILEREMPSRSSATSTPSTPKQMCHSVDSKENL